MTPKEIIDTIQNAYNSGVLKYEVMFSHFVNLSGFNFQTVILKQGSQLIRARYTDKFESFQKVNEISYPSKEYVFNFSRLNRPRQNIFYASESEKACLLEMLPYWFDEFEIGDTILVTLGKWIARHDLKLLIIPDHHNLNTFNKKVISQMELSEIEFWDFISDKFKTSTKDDGNIYEFTSAFGNALWLNSKLQNINAKGFIYSSVQSPENVNIAIDTNSIDIGDLVPSDVIEARFHKIDAKNSILPVYREIGERKRGFVNLDKSKINWF